MRCRRVEALIRGIDPTMTLVPNKHAEAVTVPTTRPSPDTLSCRDRVARDLLRCAGDWLDSGGESSPPDIDDHVIGEDLVDISMKFELNDPVVARAERVLGVGHAEQRSECVDGRLPQGRPVAPARDSESDAQADRPGWQRFARRPVAGLVDRVLPGNRLYGCGGANA